MVGREGGTGGRGPAELDVAVGEATELTVAVAVLPQRAELRLVRRAAARWGQHLAAVEAGGIPIARVSMGGGAPGSGRRLEEVRAGRRYSRWHINVVYNGKYAKRSLQKNEKKNVYMIYLKRNIKLNPKYNIYSTKKL
jgi:hypothetical protein